MLGVALFMVGLFGLAANKEAMAGLDAVPDSVMYLIVGLIAVLLFFPFFMVLYFGRHLLLSVTRLEDEVRRLKGSTNTPQGEKNVPSRDTRA